MKILYLEQPMKRNINGNSRRRLHFWYFSKTDSHYLGCHVVQGGWSPDLLRYAYGEVIQQPRNKYFGGRSFLPVFVRMQWEPKHGKGLV